MHAVAANEDRKIGPGTLGTRSASHVTALTSGEAPADIETMRPARPVVSRSAESPSPPPLVVRCFAAALRTWSAAEVLVKAFLHALPFLFAAVFRAGPTSRNVLLATVALVLDLVQSFVTFLAAEALLRNRPWARPWIICVSLMAVVPLLAGGDRWVAGWQELARQADQPLRVAIVLLGGQGFVVVAGIALLVLVVYEPIARSENGRERHALLSALSAAA